MKCHHLGVQSIFLSCFVIIICICEFVLPASFSLSCLFIFLFCLATSSICFIRLQKAVEMLPSLLHTLAHSHDCIYTSWACTNAMFSVSIEICMLASIEFVLRIARFLNLNWFCCNPFNKLNGDGRRMWNTTSNRISLQGETSAGQHKKLNAVKTTSEWANELESMEHRIVNYLWLSNITYDLCKYIQKRIERNKNNIRQRWNVVEQCRREARRKKNIAPIALNER